MTSSSKNMVIDRVDDENHVIGRITRKEVFEAKANFRVVHVVVRNLTGQILVQKIAAGLRHPGAWGSSVAGYVKAGETYRQAASRKLKEEIGLSLTKLKSFGTTSMVDDGCRKFIGVYGGTHSGPLKLMPTHVAGIEFLDLADIAAEHAAHRRDFTPTFIHLMRYLHPDVFIGGRRTSG